MIYQESGAQSSTPMPLIQPVGQILQVGLVHGLDLHGFGPQV